MAEKQSKGWIVPIFLMFVGVLMLAAAMLVAGCTPKNAKVDLPEGATTAEVVELTKVHFVGIKPELTRHPATIPEGPIDEVIEVAKDRGDALRQCYWQLDEISKIQGTPVVPASRSPGPY